MFAHRRILDNQHPDPLRSRAAKTLNALTPWAAAFIRVDSSIRGYSPEKQFGSA